MFISYFCCFFYLVILQWNTILCDCYICFTCSFHLSTKFDKWKGDKNTILVFSYCYILLLVQAHLLVKDLSQIKTHQCTCSWIVSDGHLHYIILLTSSNRESLLELRFMHLINSTSLMKNLKHGIEHKDLEVFYVVLCQLWFVVSFSFIIWS